MYICSIQNRTGIAAQLSYRHETMDFEKMPRKKTMGQPASMLGIQCMAKQTKTVEQYKKMNKHLIYGHFDRCRCFSVSIRSPAMWCFNVGDSHLALLSLSLCFYLLNRLFSSILLCISACVLNNTHMLWQRRRPRLLLRYVKKRILFYSRINELRIDIYFICNGPV